MVPEVGSPLSILPMFKGMHRRKSIHCPWPHHYFRDTLLLTMYAPKPSLLTDLITFHHGNNDIFRNLGAILVIDKFPHY